VRKIIIIGGSAAGMTAAIAAAEQDPSAEVTVITSDRVPYRRPAVPALIAGYITEPSDIKVFSPETLKRHGVKLLCPAEVTNIDSKNKNISVKSNGKESKLLYDSAVIATGGLAKIPKIAGADKKGVCTFTTYESAAEIAEIAKNTDCAMVIGAGFIALEIAEALMHKGLDVYFNVRSRILRTLLEPDVSEMLMHKFEQQGLQMLTGQAISEIGGSDRVEYVIHKSNKLTTNLVVLGAGVNPNVALAKKCDIELGASGAIRVDNQMQTSAKDIYAAGDCTETLDLSTSKYTYSPVGSIGALAGRIAGRNAAGANLQTDGFLRAQADNILGAQIYSIGHSTTTAKNVNLQVEVHNLDAHQMGEQNRIAKPFEMGKLLTNREDKIVGAQLISKKHGSQFSWQLYRAVLTGENRKDFLGRFDSTRAKMVQALVDAKQSKVMIDNISVDTSFTLKLSKKP